MRTVGTVNMGFFIVVMVIMTAVGPTLVAHQGFQSFLTLFRRQLVQLQATSTVWCTVCSPLQLIARTSLQQSNTTGLPMQAICSMIYIYICGNKPVKGYVRWVGTATNDSKSV